LAPEATTKEIVSGTQGETPHTSKSPLSLRRLARASRNRRFPATKYTEHLLFGIPFPGQRLGFTMSDLDIIKLC
jgi:hypothetical protein